MRVEEVHLIELLSYYLIHSEVDPRSSLFLYFVLHPTAIRKKFLLSVKLITQGVEYYNLKRMNMMLIIDVPERMLRERVCHPPLSLPHPLSHI